MTYNITKATPIHFTIAKCDIEKPKFTELVIIVWDVINALGSGHTHKHTPSYDIANLNKLQ